MGQMQNERTGAQVLTVVERIIGSIVALGVLGFAIADIAHDGSLSSELIGALLFIIFGFTGRAQDFYVMRKGGGSNATEDP